MLSACIRGVTVVYLDYNIRRKRKGKPQEIEARKATGLRPRVNFFHHSRIWIKSERTVSRAAETVTEKKIMKSYGFFIESILNTFKKSLISVSVQGVRGQSMVEYTLIFVAFALGVVYFIARARTGFTGHFNSAVAHILQ